MKFANVDGLKREAQPNLRGECRDCNTRMTAKCGDHNLWHWAHYRKSECDRWWEPETSWHREWKNEFPEDWQEVRHSAPDGEVHRADVKTAKENVLEFQYSVISPAERVSRENFYKPMNWVVCGTNWKRDLPSFQKALKSALPISFAPLKLLMPVKGSSILERWAGSLCPVYLDFGNVNFHEPYEFHEPVLWRLKFNKQGTHAIAIPVSRRNFIEHHRNNGKLQGCRLPIPRMTFRVQSGLPGFDRYLLGQEAKRRRFRARF